MGQEIEIMPQVLDFGPQIAEVDLENLSISFSFFIIIFNFANFTKIPKRIRDIKAGERRWRRRLITLDFIGAGARRLPKNSFQKILVYGSQRKEIKPARIIFPSTKPSMSRPDSR